MTATWFGSGRTVYGDSWFASPATAQLHFDHGLFSVMNVKGHRAGYPKTLTDGLDEPYTSAVMYAEVPWLSKGRDAVPVGVLMGEAGGEPAAAAAAGAAEPPPRPTPMMAIAFKSTHKTFRYIATRGDPNPTAPIIKWIVTDLAKRQGHPQEMTRPIVLEEYAVARPVVDDFNHTVYGGHQRPWAWRLGTQFAEAKDVAQLFQVVEANAFVAAKFLLKTGVRSGYAPAIETRMSEHDYFRRNLAAELMHANVEEEAPNGTNVHVHSSLDPDQPRQNVRRKCTLQNRPGECSNADKCTTMRCSCDRRVAICQNHYHTHLSDVWGGCEDMVCKQQKKKKKKKKNFAIRKCKKYLRVIVFAALFFRV